MQNSNFKDAINSKVVGLNNLTPNQKLELENIDIVINNIKEMKASGKYDYYLYALPSNFVVNFLTGQHIINQWGRKLEIMRLRYIGSKNDYLCLVRWERNDRSWKMFLRTILDECRFIDPTKRIKDKYLKMITPENVDQILAELEAKKLKYNNMYNQQQSNADLNINNEISQYENNVVVSREAVRKAVRDLEKDEREIANAFNSYLSPEEQHTLIDWIARNIYSMRLYVVKGTQWEQAIKEKYPEEIYGKARVTEPSPASKNSISGYISINSIDDDVPYEILKKITHKKNSEDIIKYYGANKYRINSYLLVLFLLNNYNDKGFKIGKTNLNKDIRL